MQNVQCGHTHTHTHTHTPLTKTQVANIITISLCLEPWERFMTKYTHLHPGLIDKEGHTLTPSTPASSHVNPGKHERTEDVTFDYSETKKPKYVLCVIL